MPTKSLGLNLLPLFDAFKLKQNYFSVKLKYNNKLVEMFRVRL